MGINFQHPYYDEFKEDWITMRDLYRGERVVKRKNETYLPATAGMHMDGMGRDSAGKPKPGQCAYDAYKLRAYFADFVREGVEALIGMMHQKPATFELPDVMKPLIEKCALTGEGLQEILRRINTEQLITGRVGILADLPVNPPAPQPGEVPQFVLPYIAVYIAEAIINWDQADLQEGYHALNMVVLNESGFIRIDNFTWREVLKYRVLQLGDMFQEEAEGTAEYQMGIFSNREGANNLEYNPAAMKTPMYKGIILKEIPFVFINSKDIVAVPDDPPLLGLGKLALAIYRGDADYRQTLFMSGQDTLVVIGGVRKADGTADDDPLRTGAGARIDVELGGDAKYIGVTANGLAEQRQSLQNDRNMAAQKAGRLVQNNGTKQDESGEALKTRITAQTATLNQIAIAGAKGLENLLKIMGKWMGLSDVVIETIKVTPNLEFADFALVAQDIVQLMTAKSMGAPLSKESVHGILVDRGITQMSFEDEMEKISEEVADMPTTPGPLLPGNQQGQGNTSDLPDGPQNGPDPFVDPNNPSAPNKNKNNNA